MTLLIFAALTLIEAIYVWYIWNQVQDYIEVAKMFDLHEHHRVKPIVKFIGETLPRYKQYIFIIYILVGIINIVLASIISVIITLVMLAINF